MKFTYKAQKKDGEIVKGEIEAVDKFALARTMKEEGSFLISAEPQKDRGSQIMVTLNKLFSSIKPEEKISFIRNLGSMIEAGLPLTRALAVLGRQTKNPAFKEVIDEVSQSITKGSDLAVALSKHEDIFSAITIAMIRAGERSGTLAGALKIVALQLEQGHLLVKRVKGAMIYPSIIITAMIIVGILMLIFVVPALTGTFKELGVELPVATKVLIGVSDFLRNNAILSLVLVVALGVGVFFGLRSPRGRRLTDFAVVHIPVIGTIAKQVNAARTTRTLSSLLSSGVDMVEAISITRNVVQNSYYQEILDEAGDRVQKGVPLSSVFADHEDLYPLLVGEMISVGEETGKLSAMLMNVTVYYEEEVTRVTKDLSTIIEPILMVVIGGGVGFFAYSMITPLYSVLGGI